jgi:hypothetical protein
MRTLLAFSLTILAAHPNECGKREDSPVTATARHSTAISSPLPWTYSLHGVVQQCEPTAVVEPLDYGGVASAAVPRVSLDASTWTGTFFRYQGLDANDPYQPGRPLVVPAVEDVVVAVAPYAAAASGRVYSGEVGMRLREFGAGTHVNILSSNTVRALHARPREPARRFRYFTRDHIALSAPVGRHMEVLLSATGQWAGTDESDTRLRFANARLRWDGGNAGQLSGGFTGTHLGLSAGGLPAGFEPLAARRAAPPLWPSPFLAEDDKVRALQFAWAREEAQIGYGYTAGRLDTHPTGEAPVSGVPRVDLFSGEVDGAPLFWNDARRSRHEIRGLFGAGGFSLAAGWQTAEAVNRPVIPGLTHILTLDGAQQVVTRFHPLRETIGRTAVGYAFLRYEQRWTSWLSVMAALQADRSTGGAIAWNSLAPRAGFALRHPRSDWLVLRATYARTVQTLPARLLDFGDPGSISGEEFLPDGTLLRRFGGRYSGIDPRLSRPYRDEFTAGLEAGLGFGIFFRIRLFRSDDKRRPAAVNTGVGESAYRPVTILDPGGDFSTPADDRMLTVFAQEPTTFGQDRFVFTNPAGLNTQNSGLVAQTGMDARRWSVLFSFAAEKSFGPTNAGNRWYDNDAGIAGNLFADPNTLINATGRSFFDRAFIGKAVGWYRMPGWLGELEVGGILNYVDGLVFGRRLLVEGMPQGPFVVFATVRGSPEGGHRTEYHASLDLRLSREFRLGAGRIRINADVFNAGNAAFKLVEEDRSGPRFNERLPLLHQPGRLWRFGLAYEL